jgi:hypothetical protein
VRAYAAELDAARDAKIGQLLDQVQLNSQHMPYYPQVGPFPADTTPEQKRYYSVPPASSCWARTS